MNKKSKEKLIQKILFLCASISILTTLGIILVLSIETISFFEEVSIFEFLFGTEWRPLLRPQSFGILPLINGTLMITILSGIIALPIGLLSAIYLSEYANENLRRILKPLLEILAGIPTVVYGYFAIVFITPLIKGIIPETQIFNALSASIVVGIMILPMVSSLSEDALRAVPRSIREAAYALGSRKFQVSLRVVVPSAFSGIVASFILALSRAIGETMAVTIAAGMTPKITLNPLESIQTMTSYIVQVSLGDTPYGTIEFKTIFAVAMVLFMITLVMNLLSQWIKEKYKETYQ